MTQTKFSTLPKENWDSETDIEPKNVSPADDWNQITSEAIDVIEKGGEPADTNLRIARVIMKNALCADFFTDTSTVSNTIVLTDNGTFAKPIEYTDGMKVSFLANYSNTGSTTINVNGLGVKNIYLDANSSPLTGSEIKEKEFVNLRYNSTLGGFIIVLGGGGGTARNIGEIVQSDLPLTDAGLHLLDGELILAGGSYNAFYLHMKDLYDGGLYPDLFTSEANWQSDNSNFGGCEKYVFTDGVSVRLPKAYDKNRFVISSGGTAPAFWRIYNDGWIEQGNSTNSSAFTMNATIPLLIPMSNTNYHINGIGVQIQGVGAQNILTKTTTNFSVNSAVQNTGTGWWEVRGYGTIPNGYDKPEYNYICVATTTKTDVVIDIDNVMTDLSALQHGTTAIFDTLDNTAKTNIFNITKLSYSSAITVSTIETETYVPIANGVLLCSYTGAEKILEIKYNNSSGIVLGLLDSNSGAGCTLYLPVYAGESYYFSHRSSGLDVYFIPYNL